MRHVLLLLCLSFLACDEPSRGASPEPAGDLVPAAPAAPQGVARAGSQEELADELDAVAKELDPGAAAALQRRWQGKRVRWTVTRVPALCGSAESCYVQPFATARRSETSAHGWLPRVALAPGEFARLEEVCAKRSVCSVTLEGVIDRLVVSDEEPTSVHLSLVHVEKDR
ncbi:MAG: hypothetical protein R3B48_07045 [Kofleriaceae bacterium]